MLLLRLWFVSPMRCLVKAGQQLTMFLRGLYAPVQISATTVRTRSTEQSLSAPSLHTDRCSFTRPCRRPHHHVYRPGLPSELAPCTHRLWTVASHEAAPHSYDPLARDELRPVQEDGDLCASPRRPYEPTVLRMLTCLSVPQRAKPATRKEMAQFHTDEYVDFLSRVTPDLVEQAAEGTGGPKGALCRSCLRNRSRRC